jgi:hypothetical protein
MKRASAIALLCSTIALAGCASTSVGVAGVTPSMQGSMPAPGSSYSSGVVFVDASTNGYIALLLMGLVAAGAQDDYQTRNYGPAGRIPPQLDEGRAVAERDCSLPMEAPSANLRCK